MAGGGIQEGEKHVPLYAKYVHISLDQLLNKVVWSEGKHVPQIGLPFK